MGTVFECSFLLHGGGIVTSGPATVTLTPTEGSSPPQCNEEVTRGSCIYKCNACTSGTLVDHVRRVLTTLHT